MSPVLTLLTCLDETAGDRLIQQISFAGHDIVARLDTAHDLVSAIRGPTPDGIVVSATRRHLTLDVLAEADDAGIRMVAVAADDAERRYALSLGLFEVVDARASWNDIEALLRGGVAVPRAPSSEGEAGTVIAVWGPAGAPGRTTVAIQLAAELAFRGRTVALVDADTYGGTIAPSLGMLDEAPSFAAACRLARDDSLTLAELERVASRYTSPRSAFWVLSGIGRVVALARARCRSCDDRARAPAATGSTIVVVDTGFNLETDEEISSDMFAPRRNAATLAALRQADRVVAVGSADPIGLSRFLRAHVDLLEQVETAEISVVINRLRASSVGSNAQGQVRQTLRSLRRDRRRRVPTARYGAASMRRCWRERPLLDAAPRSPVRTGYRATRRSEHRRTVASGHVETRGEAGGAAGAAGVGPLQMLRARRLG